jgi:hypothetical protein
MRWVFMIYNLVSCQLYATDADHIADSDWKQLLPDQFLGARVDSMHALVLSRK